MPDTDSRPLVAPLSEINIKSGLRLSLLPDRAVALRFGRGSNKLEAVIGLPTIVDDVELLSLNGVNRGLPDDRPMSNPVVADSSLMEMHAFRPRPGSFLVYGCAEMPTPMAYFLERTR